MRKALLGAVILTGIVMTGCSDIADSLSAAFAVSKVDFSSASPNAVTSPRLTTSWSPTCLCTPGWKDVNLEITFNVRADNSKNTSRAAFGSDAIKPSLNFYVGDTVSNPISVTVKPFSIPGGTDTTIQFPITIPLSTVYSNSPNIVKQIANSTPIPYRLSASLAFVLETGAGTITGPTCDLNLVTGGIPTDLSGASAVLKLLN